MSPWGEKNPCVLSSSRNSQCWVKLCPAAVLLFVHITTRCSAMIPQSEISATHWFFLSQSGNSTSSSVWCLKMLQSHSFFFLSWGISFWLLRHLLFPRRNPNAYNGHLICPAITKSLEDVTECLDKNIISQDALKKKTWYFLSMKGTYNHYQQSPKASKQFINPINFN